MLHLSQRAMGSESSNIPVSTDSPTQRRDRVLARITDIRRERVRGGGRRRPAQSVPALSRVTSLRGPWQPIWVGRALRSSKQQGVRPRKTGWE